jgi:hypothetical protein
MARRRDGRSCASGASCGSVGAVYGLGFVGAAVYYISVADSFWMGAFGIFKALFWPGFLVFEVLKFLGA